MGSNGLKITTWCVLITAITVCLPVITRSDRLRRVRNALIFPITGLKRNREIMRKGARPAQTEQKRSRKRKEEKENVGRDLDEHSCSWSRSRHRTAHLPPIIFLADYLAPISPSSLDTSSLYVDRGHFNFVQIASLIGSPDQCFNAIYLRSSNIAPRIMRTTRNLTKKCP